MTRKTAIAGSSYLCGLFIGSFFALELSAALGTAMLTAGALVFLLLRPQRGSKGFTAAFVCISAALGILYYCLCDTAERLPAEKYDGAEISGECLITEAEHFSKGAEYTVRLSLESGKKINAVMTSFNEASLYEGDRCIVRGRLSLLDSDSFFDEKGYYSGKGIFLKLEEPEIISLSVNKNSLSRIAEGFRKRVADTVRSTVSSDAGEIVMGMIFGRSGTDISAGTQRALKRSGIMHILSVSGMHMSVAAAFAAFLSGSFSKWIRYGAVMAAVLIYGAAAGFTVPVIRSIIMIAIVYSAPLAGRRSDPLTSLMTASVLITLSCPFCISDISFLLTFSGVFGSAVLAPAMNEYIVRHIEIRKGREPDGRRPDFTPLLVPFCAAIAVFPVSALCFDEISAVSPLVNLIAVPLSETAAVLAIGGAVLCAVPFISVLSRVIFYLSGLLCRTLIKLCCLVSAIPGAAIPSDLPVIKPMIVMTFIVTAAGFIMLKDNISRGVVFSACVLICTVSAAVYWSVPMSGGGMTVLSEGKGCIILVYNGRSTDIYDLCGTGRGAKAAVSYIRRKGTGSPSMAVMLSGNGGEDIYSGEFPDALLMQADDDSLTYSVKHNIIGIGDCRLTAENGFAAISAGGADIICINKKCVLPDGSYDLAVYNCRAAVSVNADMYAVTRRSFKGSIPAGKDCTDCTTAEYVLYDGEIYPKEETLWLR